MNKLNHRQNILITGGAGFIGSHLVNYLIKKGHRITILDNLERGSLDNIPISSSIVKSTEDWVTHDSDNLNFVNCDLRSYESFKKFFKNQNIVIHLASKVGGIGTYLSKPYEILSSNICIDSNVLKAVLENKIKKYFYASSAHVYPKELQASSDALPMAEDKAYPANPELTYGWAKLMGEKAIESSLKENPWLQASIARFIGIYGPNQDFNFETGSVIPVFCHRALRYPDVEFKAWGTGKETRSYCYINDTLECIEKMINQNKSLTGPYNVGSEIRISISEIANLVKEISGKDIEVEWDSSKETVIWGQVCDCSLVEKELSWKASTKLKQGLKSVYTDILSKI